MRKFIQWVGIGSFIVVSGAAVAVTSNIGPSPGARTAQGSNSGAQYDDIARRNVFGLKDLPQPATTNNTPPADPAIPKLTLTGITTILGNKLALFKVQFPGEGNKPGKEDSLMLAEGQREDGIEVLQIDEKAKRVRVNNSGRMMPIEFDKDSLKSTGGTNSPAPAGTAPGQNPATPGFHIPRLPSRNLQVPNPTGAAPANAPLPPPNPFSRTPSASYGTTNSTAAGTLAASQNAYSSNSAGVYQNAPAAVGTTPQPLTPTGLSPEQIAALQAAAAAADAQTQAVRQVPAPLERAPTMPLVPQY